jgi:hypothetical protein
MTLTLVNNGDSILTRVADGTQLIKMDATHLTPYNTTAASWMPQADQHSTPQQNPSGGDVTGAFLEGGKLLTQTVMFEAYQMGNTAQAVTDRLALEGVWDPAQGECMLSWRLGDRDFHRFGRCVGMAVTQGKALNESATLNFRSDDPRSYSVEETAYLATASATVHNPGNRPSIAWRITVAGPYTGGRLDYHVIGGNLNSLRLPDCPSGSTFSIDARRGEARITDGSGNWVAVTGRVIDVPTGHPGRFMRTPVGDSVFAFTSATGTTVMDAYVHGCWP